MNLSHDNRTSFISALFTCNPQVCLMLFHSLIVHFLCISCRSNLPVTRTMWWIRAAVINVFVFFIVFFLTTPTYVLNLVNQLQLTDRLQIQVSFIEGGLRCCGFNYFRIKLLKVSVLLDASILFAHIRFCVFLLLNRLIRCPSSFSSKLP